MKTEWTNLIEKLQLAARAFLPSELWFGIPRPFSTPPWRFQRGSPSGWRGILPYLRARPGHLTGSVVGGKCVSFNAHGTAIESQIEVRIAHRIVHTIVVASRETETRAHRSPQGRPHGLVGHKLVEMMTQRWQKATQHTYDVKYFTSFTLSRVGNTTDSLGDSHTYM